MDIGRRIDNNKIHELCHEYGAGDMISMFRIMDKSYGKISINVHSLTWSSLCEHELFFQFKSLAYSNVLWF